MSNTISIILIAASAGLFFGYVNPTYGGVTGNAERSMWSIQELAEERGRYADALEKTREIEQARVGLLEKYNRIPLEHRERIEKLLPDHIDSVRLIIDINTLASQYGMTLKNITLLDAQTGTTRSPTPAIGPREERAKSAGLKFAVSGSYDDFRSFLRDLEQNLRLVDVGVLAFSAQTDSPQYEYGITLSTYRLNAPSAPVL